MKIFSVYICNLILIIFKSITYILITIVFTYYTNLSLQPSAGYLYLLKDLYFSKILV